MADSDTRLIAGCMTGTSLDGLDAALVAVSGRGLEMRARFIGMVSRPLGALREELRHFACGGAAEPIRFLRAARKLGELHADAVAALCEQEGCKQLDFVVAHGQTIWHAPDENLSWQLFDPWPLVRLLQAPVCYDLRQADLIAGGQGAPITPLSDWVMYRKSDCRRLIVNLGGICNITDIDPAAYRDPSAINASDIGPCNLLIDGFVQRLFPPLQFDDGGKIARRGIADDRLRDLIWNNPFFKEKHRTAGREHFNAAWIDKVIQELSAEGLTNEDMVAEAVQTVAYLVVMMPTSWDQPAEVVLAGGGARNPALVDEIRAASLPQRTILLSDEFGIPCEAREAMGFAVLGALSQDGVPITLPQVTRAVRPGIAGAWVYP